MVHLSTRDIIHDGFRCVADMDTDEYIAAGNLSQAKTGFNYQLNYGNYILYFGCSLIFIFLLKSGWYFLIDAGYNSELKTSDFLKNQIVYAKLRRESSGSCSSSDEKSLPSLNYSNTSNYSPSIIPKSTALLRNFTYKKLPHSIVEKGVPNLNLGIYFILALCTTFTMAMSLGPHPYYRQCQGFGSPPLAVRSGIMASMTLFYIFILSGKTNVVSIITNISYEKLYVYHKYVSYCCFSLIFAHMVPFVYQSTHEGGYAQWRTIYHSDPMYLSGFVAFGCLAVLCLASLPCIRKMSHEVFFHFHWAVACVFFAVTIWHIGNTLNIWAYLWVLLGIWIGQLIFRIGFKTALKPNKWFLRPKISNFKKLDNETFEIEIFNSGIHWEAGQHIFMRLTGSKIFQNHPFTIANIPSSRIPNSNNIKLIIRSRNGLTKILNDQLSSMSNNDPENALVENISKPVYIDGPYGVITRDILKFDNAVLISSGSGVTFTLPLLKNYCKQIQDSIQPDVLCSEKNQPIIKKVRFIWIIKSFEQLTWIENELKECFELGERLVQIDIYITRDAKVESIDTQVKIEVNETTKELNQIADNNSWCTIHYQKPKLDKLIRETLKQDLLRRNIFLCCGTGSLSNDVSNGVASIQKCVWGNKGGFVEDIYMHTEAFGY